MRSTQNIHRGLYLYAHREKGCFSEKKLQTISSFIEIRDDDFVVY